MQKINVPTPSAALRTAYRAGRVIPWVGAGLSSAVADCKLPSYGDLIRQIVAEAARRQVFSANFASEVNDLIDAQDYKTAARSMRTHLPAADFAAIVRPMLLTESPKPSQHHVMLNLMRFKVFLTTNYDRILDQILEPQPEVLTYRDLDSLNATLDAAATDAAPVVFKLNGDISAPATIALGQSDKLGMFDSEKPLGAGIRALLERLLEHHCILFLGYSFEDPDFRSLLMSVGEELAKRKGQHVALLPQSEYEAIPDRDRFAASAGIELQPFQLQHDAADGDPYRVLWQFLSQISPGIPVDIAPDASGGSFYLTDERPRYLDLQNAFEKTADAFRFITPTLTNAFTTDAFLEQVVPQQLAAFDQSVADFPTWQADVIATMKERKATFDRKLKAGAEFRLLCDQNTAVKDIRSGDPVVVGRYRYVLDLLENEQYDVELRFWGASTESRSLRSFASLIRGNDATSDIAAAYATQGTTAEYNAHVFQLNTYFAEYLLLLFEREWARGCAEADARALLRDYLRNASTTD